MGRDFRVWMFIAVAFLLGSINVLYNIGFYIFLSIAFLLNVSTGFKDFRENIRKEKKYIVLPLIGVLYLVVHYLVTLFMDIPYKISWSMAEILLLYYFMIPVYLLSARSFMTPVLIRRFLFALCWGIMLFNITKLFCITGLSLFTEPMKALNILYSGRFGGNMELLGGQVYLEPQALYIVISALISYFFILRQKKIPAGKGVFISSIVIFILSLVFLSFTVTKGSILAFLAGFIFLSVVFLRKKSRRFQLGFAGSILVGLVVIAVLVPKAYVVRLQAMKQEIENLQDGKFKGGSIAPRMGLMIENLDHVKEFGLFGLGVYKGATVRDWYAHSAYIPKGVYNSHNSFMEFWLVGGISGLLYILYLFAAPLIRMKRRKHYSFLSIACILGIFVAGNTCMVTILVDSSALVIFSLSLFFLYADDLWRLEREEESGLLS